MKRRILLVLAAVLCLSLFAGCGVTQDVTETTTLPPEDPTYNFDVGFSVQMPEGFEEQESQLNDFFGIGNGGTFAIIANKEAKDGFADLAEYAQGIADANGANMVMTAPEGYLYINYVNETDDNHMYTVFAEGEEFFYRVAFYCPTSNWINYSSQFPQWAATVTVK